MPIQQVPFAEFEAIQLQLWQSQDENQASKSRPNYA